MRLRMCHIWFFVNRHFSVTPLTVKLCRKLDPDQLLKPLGAAFQKARHNARLSVRDLAQETGVSPSHILRMESGEFDFTVTKFLKLADALGLPAGVLCEVALFSSGVSPSGLDSNCAEDKEYRAIVGEDSARGFALARLIHQLFRVIAALHLSANPVALARTIDFPFRPIDDRLASYAESIEPLSDHISRRVEISAVWKYPVMRLKHAGLLDDELIKAYFEWFRENDSLVGDPWKATSTWLEAACSNAFEARPTISPPARHSKEPLDIIALANDNTDMQIVKSLAGLRQKLTRLTGKRGAKAALARKFGVSRQAVDQWLSGATSPSTEVAIQIMNLPESAK